MLWTFVAAAAILPLLGHGQIASPTQVLTANEESMKFVILGSMLISSLPLQRVTSRC